MGHLTPILLFHLTPNTTTKKQTTSAQVGTEFNISCKCIYPLWDGFGSRNLQIYKVEKS